MNKVSLAVVLLPATLLAGEKRPAAAPLAGDSPAAQLVAPPEGAAASEGGSQVAVPSSARGALRTADPLSAVRARRIAEGEAVLTIDGVDQTVHPGSLVGTDAIQSIVAGRIVLTRPQASGRPGGDGLVLVSFDDKGQPTVRVLWKENPTPVKAPPVR